MIVISSCGERGTGTDRLRTGRQQVFVDPSATKQHHQITHFVIRTQKKKLKHGTVVLTAGDLFELFSRDFFD